jgi:arabinose-5-phosphate isomerase
MSNVPKDIDHPALEEGRRVLEVESAAIRALIPRLDGSFVSAVEMIAGTEGRVVTTGMGKSGIICRKLTATLASTGTPSLFLHPAEAIHGDLGMVKSGDVVILISNSGETEEVVRLLEPIRRLGARMIGVSGNPSSSLGRNCDVHLYAGIEREACPMGLAPTASTTAALAICDALAMAVLTARGFKEENFAFLHPGGKLGKKFLRVKDLMHAGEKVPSVAAATSMRDVIYEMSKKGFGITAVVDSERRLLGVISDGDLRRLIEKDEQILHRDARSSMNPNPRTIDDESLASAALQRMESAKITSLFVVGHERLLLGIIHIHDLWGLELF